MIFVFSLENEQSFNAVYNFYAKMAHYRNTADIPMLLVGTQGMVLELWLFMVRFEFFRCDQRK